MDAARHFAFNCLLGNDGTEIFYAENSAYLCNILRRVCLSCNAGVYYARRQLRLLCRGVYKHNRYGTFCFYIHLRRCALQKDFSVYQLCKRVQYVCVYFAYAVQYIFQGSIGNCYILCKKYHKNRFVYSCGIDIYTLFAPLGESRVGKTP